MQLNLNSISLTQRMIASAATLMLLFLGLTGFALDRAFVNSQMAAQSEQLFIRVFNLLSVAEPDDNTLILPRLLEEGRFNSPESGLIGLVLNDEQQSVWESLSSEWFTEGDWLRSQKTLQAGEEEFGKYKKYVYQRNAFVYEVRGNDQVFEFWVLENADALNSSIQTFRQQLWGGFITVTIALLIVMSFVTAWGLKPLRTLAIHLHKIRTGEAEELTGNYPKELTPLTDSLNQLLKVEQTQRERYRKAMADLAHSLKTPLAVMQTLSPNDKSDLKEQVDRMNQIVRYQLQRAVTDARTGVVLGQRCDLYAALNRLGSALEKAYRTEDMVLDIPESSEDLFVAMDSNDVLEVFGNLLENGFKYGRSVISVVIETSQKNISSNYCVVHIDDDGDGIPLQARSGILARGKRLDSLQPGQGIGLAMVTDILASYQVQIEIYDSPLGGARFSFKLPLAQR